MKAGWENVRLDGICKIARGGSPRPIKKFITDDPDGINWIKIGDSQVGGRYIDNTAQKIIKEGIPRSRFVTSGSFLLSNSMSFGRPYILRTDGCIHDGWLVLEPDYSRVDQQYLYYALGSRVVFDQFNALAAGSTVRNLNIDLVSKVVAPLPPLEEQKRIVAVLDGAFEGLDRARTHIQTNLQNARELFEGYLAQAFSNQGDNWKLQKLSTLCERITVGFVGPMAHHYEATGIPFLRSQNIRAFELDLEGVKFIGDDFNEEIKKSKLRPGDVAIVRTGYPGTAAVIPKTLQVSNCADLVIATPKSSLSPHFLAMFLNSEFGKRMVAEKSVGAAQKHFNVGAAKAVDFPTPPPSEQESLVQASAERRQDCTEIAAHYTTKLADLDDLRQSLLQKAFAGELT